MQIGHHELLLATMAQPGIAEATWHRWRTAADIDTLDAPSLSLLPLLFRRRPELLANDPWQGRVKGLYWRNWCSNQRLLGVCAKGLTALRERGIQAMVLDDLATLELARDDLGVLKLDELALLVREADFFAAIEVLEGRGWCLLDGNLSMAGMYASMRTVRYQHREGGRLALRTRLPPPPCLTLNNVWETAATSSLFGQPAFLPARMDHLLWVLLACLSPPRASSLIKLAGAIALIEGAAACLDWDRFVQTARETRSSLLAVAALAEIGEFISLPADLLEQLSAASATATERRYLVACRRWGMRHDWALFQLLRERGDLSVPVSAILFGHFLIQSRGGGSVVGTLRWLVAAVQRRLQQTNHL
ncbi:MAG: hypothetical protein EOM24_22790 [Chloroflexia bacterium]|nr:hypothetical protein [Chloroflexia bacterium]